MEAYEGEDLSPILVYAYQRTTKNSRVYVIMGSWIKDGVKYSSL